MSELILIIYIHVLSGCLFSQCLLIYLDFLNLILYVTCKMSLFRIMQVMNVDVDVDVDEIF